MKTHNGTVPRAAQEFSHITDCYGQLLREFHVFPCKLLPPAASRGFSPLMEQLSLFSTTWNGTGARKKKKSSKLTQVFHLTCSKPLRPDLPTHFPLPPYLLLALPVFFVVCFPSDCFRLLRMSISRERERRVMGTTDGKGLSPGNTFLHLQILLWWFPGSLAFALAATAPSSSSAHSHTAPSGWIATVGGHQEDMTTGWPVSWTWTIGGSSSHPSPVLTFCSLLFP